MKNKINFNYKSKNCAYLCDKRISIQQKHPFNINCNNT